jgi:hypothetical protein
MTLVSRHAASGAHGVARFSLWAAAGCGLMSAEILGLLNGLLVTTTKINSFIATLSTMMVYRGIAMVLSQGQEGRIFAHVAGGETSRARVAGLSQNGHADTRDRVGIGSHRRRRYWRPIDGGWGRQYRWHLHRHVYYGRGTNWAHIAGDGRLYSGCVCGSRNFPCGDR